MPIVIHINDKISIAGGVEVYISQLQPLLREVGWESSWVGIKRTGSLVTIESDNELLNWQGSIEALGDSPIAHLAANGGGILHVHSLSKPKILQQLFKIAPVVRTMHEQRLFCPGQGKFWARSGQVCEQPVGLHCLLHAYQQKCCSRHPGRLFRAYRNVSYELKQASHLYSRILTNSRYIRDEATLAGVPKEKISLLHCFTPPVIETIDPAKEPGIVFLGRLSRTKGVHYLLQAMRSVLDSVPSARLDLLGDGIDQEEFKRLAEDFGVADNTTFHGWVDREKIDHYINRASVVAFPSIYPEAFGIVGIEAMMRSKPVVAFDVGGVKDWLENDKTGVLVTPRDTQGFADALIRLLKDPEVRKQMGKNGRDRAMEAFSPEGHIEKIMAIYADALRTNRTQ